MMRLSRLCRPLCAVFALAQGMACASVSEVRVRPDFDQSDATQTVRLAVVVQPSSGAGASVDRLWLAIARRYANDHRDYIVRAAWDAQAACTGPTEGVLRLEPAQATLADGRVELDLVGRLIRCRDGQEVWHARVREGGASVDARYAETIHHYGEELGPEVVGWVAPSFHALSGLLETLPRPRLVGDEAEMEKIELADTPAGEVGAP